MMALSNNIDAFSPNPISFDNGTLDVVNGMVFAEVVELIIGVTVDLAMVLSMEIMGNKLEHDRTWIQNKIK